MDPVIISMLIPGKKGYLGRHTYNDVAETAFRSDEFALGFASAVVTNKKFVRFVGSAAHNEAPATARNVKVEKRIVCKYVEINVSKQTIRTITFETKICGRFDFGKKATQHLYTYLQHTTLGPIIRHDISKVPQIPS
jgi:hypothetical protein